MNSVCDVHVNIPSTGYEPVEDLHLVILHIILYVYKQLRQQM